MHPLFTVGHSTHPWERFAALFGAEKDPLACHRTILVCRNLGE